MKPREYATEHLTLHKKTVKTNTQSVMDVSQSYQLPVTRSIQFLNIKELNKAPHFTTVQLKQCNR